LRRANRFAVLLLLLVVLPTWSSVIPSLSRDLLAQDIVPNPPRPVVPSPPSAIPSLSRDTSRSSPLNFFFRSLLIPGWGQASLDRKLTGGLFIAFEGLAVAMSLKTNHELRYLEQTGSGRIDDKRQERQDWLFLVAVNHLFSGLEAYVSASLFDFPADLRMQVLPGGRRGFGVTIPVPQR